MKIFKNYGVLGLEKEVIYTYTSPISPNKCYDIIEVEIPEGWKRFKDGVLESPWGWKYTIDNLLASANEEPAFTAIMKNGRWYQKMLTVLNKE